MTREDEAVWLIITVLALLFGSLVGAAAATTDGPERERCEHVFNAAAVSGQSLHPSVLYVCDYDLPEGK